jgi:4-diphosphocytidyl-2-C-methyl-D-erythritol kinase
VNSSRLPGPDYPAPAKLNLFLHVVGRRPDGYHLLQSVFTLIDFADRIRLRVREDGAVRRVSDLPGVGAEEDLAVRAANALRQATGTRLGADIEVEKRIPMGGGLGGGSSDAATVLVALNRLWATGLDRRALQEIGAGLGADVPFFVFGETAWVEGVGERLRPVAVPPRWYAVLVPPVQVPTGEVFAAPELTRNTEALKMEDFSAQPPGGRSMGLDDSRFHNDLEPVAVARYPSVAEHLAWLGRHGKARMSGSGSCLFAAFERREEAQAVIDALPEGMKGFIARGIGRHPLRG